MAVAAAVLLAALLLATRALARRLDTVEVHGGSMVPALHPGDRLLVESWTYGRRPPRAGEVVLAADPRSPARELVKRVASIGDGRVELRGDAVASTDSRSFGGVPVDAVRWRAAVRYWPPARAGKLSRAG